ncbi:Pdr17p-like Sec14 domain-containing protein [Cryptosporidium canis]|uniref:Pdr17p-like Sec14 domain-containing protein n=1 Tax=Cryptosporidium canis TaxID=195482 RepID=A0ABQ8P3E0_9CRYT|nr:Pdr17p-like Sec14 domain-containing protein [Cryptosporidium canis]KAJ1609110.1 Pdr17p-like Sec14 domain-containing protein [Cryptosporidium canis]
MANYKKSPALSEWKRTPQGPGAKTEKEEKALSSLRQLLEVQNKAAENKQNLERQKAANGLIKKQSTSEAVFDKIKHFASSAFKNKESCVISSSSSPNKPGKIIKTRLLLKGPLNPYELDWCTDACLLRYLRGYNLKVIKSFEALAKTIHFRRKYAPQFISPRNISSGNSVEGLIRYGLDKEGRPCIFMRAKYSDSNIDVSLVLNSLLYSMERACLYIDQVSTSDNKINLIVDFTGYKSTQQPPVSLSLKFAKAMVDHYPERLNRAFIIQPGWFFKAVWGLISPCIPGNTAEKFVLIDPESDGPESFNALKSYIEDRYLDKEWGGSCDEVFDPEEYWGKENTEFDQFCDFCQKNFYSEEHPIPVFVDPNTKAPVKVPTGVDPTEVPRLAVALLDDEDIDPNEPVEDGGHQPGEPFRPLNQQPSEEIEENNDFDVLDETGASQQ